MRFPECLFPRLRSPVAGALTACLLAAASPLPAVEPERFLDKDGRPLGGAWVFAYSRSSVPREVSALVDGYRDGQSTIYYPWGNRWKSMTYKRGILEGPFAVYFPDGKTLMEEGAYQNGLLNGCYCLYYQNGVKRKEFSFAAGRAQGEAREWYESGAPSWTGAYREGMGDGTFLLKSPDGSPVLEKRFDEGRFLRWRRFQ